MYKRLKYFQRLATSNSRLLSNTTQFQIRNELPVFRHDRAKCHQFWPQLHDLSATYTGSPGYSALQIETIENSQQLTLTDRSRISLRTVGIYY